MSLPANQLVVFTRLPCEGRNKTRLIPALGAAGAARFHDRLARHTIGRARDYCGSSGARLVIRLDGGTPADGLEWLGGHIFEEQGNGDLGARLDRAVRTAFDDGARSVVVIGLRGATAIYPPVAQWLFAGMSSLGLEVRGFKLIFTLADLALCWILLIRFGSKAARIYAWNPLAALSFAGGGHYDSLFILAMVLAWLARDREQGFPWRSSLLIGLAIGLKWMAAPIGLWLVFRNLRDRGLKRAFLTGLTVAAPVSLAYAALSVWTGEWTLQLMPPFFSRTARSMEFLPVIIDYCGRTGRLDNRIYLGLLVAAWILVASRARNFPDAAEWSFFATYLLSPMLHAWYLVWALPFAVKSGNPGIIGLAATGVFYFVVHYNMDHLGLGWTYTWWQRAIIWLPFLVGFLIVKGPFKKPCIP